MFGIQLGFYHWLRAIRLQRRRVASGRVRYLINGCLGYLPTVLDFRGFGPNAREFPNRVRRISVVFRRRGNGFATQWLNALFFIDHFPAVQCRCFQFFKCDLFAPERDRSGEKSAVCAVFGTRHAVIYFDR